MRGVPYGHFGRQLFGRYPVRQQPRARREPHALQPAVGDPQQPHEENQRVGELRSAGFARNPGRDIFAESECKVRQRAEGQSGSHEKAGVDPVGQYAVQETRQAVNQPVQREEDA